MNDQHSVTGLYQAGNSSHSTPARAMVTERQVVIYQQQGGQPVMSAVHGDYRFSEAIAGLPVDLIFADNSRFIPDDAGYRWKHLSKSQTITEWLETHWSAVLVAAVFLPFFLWFMVAVVIPASSNVVAESLPQVVADELGQQSLTIIDAAYMEPSELAASEQENIRQRWHDILQRLNIPPDTYSLQFRRWNHGANAMALADGTVIVTDSIARLMKDNPQQLDAVLLHEIGHVEHKHSLKILTQSTVTSLLFAMMFGDVEGMGEIMLGAGTGLAQASFSRDMERDADQFAFQELQSLGRSPQDFADAMRALEASHPLRIAAGQSDCTQDCDNNSTEPGFFDYLSSHPATEERIRAAEALAEKQKMQQ
ncbi:MAG: peptidase [Oceanospirillaceae bacterium]|nr:peptidase [Oceanospirillaceae bacterium]MBT12904.1 peptidase [Oceanospirillaceae bacterium]|tara:strand:- start:146517 stop:147614 length:1098 start_codon:yes stop_codon:yes gene_type:complete